VHSEKAGEFGDAVPHWKPPLFRGPVTHSRGALNQKYPAPRQGAFRMFAARGFVPGSAVFSYPEAKTNVLSGLTVALALVPEAIAFALVAHVNPLVGLYAAFIMCLITASFGGRPGMISGATGSTAVVNGRACPPAWNLLPLRRSRAYGHSADRLRSAPAGQVHPHGSPPGDWAL